MKKTMLIAFGFIMLMVTEFAIATQVPDTGQTKCNDVAGNVITCPSPGQALYGQDGNYSINPMSFTKLDGSGNALLVSATAGYTDNGDGTVTDASTGLMWQKADSSSEMNWKDALAYCKGLKLGGYTDWRLPNIKELLSLVDYSRYNPAINTSFFSVTSTFSFYYWSSTASAYYSGYAWGVDFVYGNHDFGDKGSNVYVRAVRGGQSGSSAGYTDNGDGTVTDASTGLMWQKADSSSEMNWKDALAYCKGLKLGGYTDWRLPNIKELLSLVDYSRYHPAINTSFFSVTSTLFSYYWSSTTYANDTDLAWGVHFVYGDHDFGDKGSNVYVRAVRGGQSGSSCTATIDADLSLHVPYLSYDNGTLSLWAEFVYEFNPTYPASIFFKLTNYAIINNPSFSCAASTLSSDSTIHIPDVLLPDGSTHLWVDLSYNQALSTVGNFYWVVSNYGSVTN